MNFEPFYHNRNYAVWDAAPSPRMLFDSEPDHVGVHEDPNRWLRSSEDVQMNRFWFIRIPVSRDLGQFVRWESATMIRMGMLAWPQLDA